MITYFLLSEAMPTYTIYIQTLNAKPPLWRPTYAWRRFIQSLDMPLLQRQAWCTPPESYAPTNQQAHLTRSYYPSGHVLIRSVKSVHGRF